MSTLRELFVHDLEDIYYAEGELLDALSELADQTDDEQAAQAFRDHREETQTHIERLEQVFDMLGVEPDTEECDGIEGLITEHKNFVEKDPDPGVLDIHNLVAGQKTEHYEIAAYGNLALLADRLDMSDAGDILHETLEEEEEALEKLATLTEEFEYADVRESATAD